MFRRGDIVNIADSEECVLVLEVSDTPAVAGVWYSCKVLTSVGERMSLPLKCVEPWEDEVLCSLPVTA